MPRRKFDPSAPYQGITGMARISGLSPGYIRELCKKGECAYILCGNEYRINKELFLQQLEEKSRESLNQNTKKAPTSAAIAGRGGDGNGSLQASISIPILSQNRGEYKP